MNYPYSIKGSKSSLLIDKFLGINRNKKASYYEFSDLENVDNSDYPCISSVKSPKRIIENSFYTTAYIEKFYPPRFSDKPINSFSGVLFFPVFSIFDIIAVTYSDTTYTLKIDKITDINIEVLEHKNVFYSNGQKYNDFKITSDAAYSYVNFTSTYDSLKFQNGQRISFGEGTKIGHYSIVFEGEVVRSDILEFTDIIDFNGTFITIPEFKGYNYLLESSTESKLINPYSTTATVTVQRDVDENNNYTVSKLIYPSGTTLRFHEGDMLEVSGFVGDYAENNTRYPKNSMDYSNIYSPVTIKVKKAYITKTSNLAQPYTNLEIDVFNAYGDLICFNTGDNDSKDFSDITLKIAMPKVSDICISNNRLFATDATGERIYASKLANPLSLYNYGSSAVSGWYGDVGTEGKFTGIITYKNTVIAFKPDNIHIIYGNTPTSYSIDKTYKIGCIDKKSIAALSDSVIWLYYDGFYSYRGGKPKRISDKLNTKYVSATAFSDNSKYYCRAKKEDGEYELLVYDSEKDIWTKLSDINFCDGCYYKGEKYITKSERKYSTDGIYKLFGDEYNDFYIISEHITYESFKTKAVSFINLRSDLDSGAFLNIYTRVNNGDWESHTGINKSGVSRFPIRYSPGDTMQFKVEGHGKITIYDLEFATNMQIN